MNNKDKVKVIFSSPILGLTDVPELLVQPAKNFIPDGWKNIPSYHDKENIDLSIYKHTKLINSATAKICPSFGDIWNDGYVLVSPCDISITHNKETTEHAWEIAGNSFNINRHGDYQYLDYVTNSGYQAVFKIDNVWTCETPKGYSIRQIPLFWHHNKSFDVAYGVIHTDQYHQVNPQIMMKDGVDEIFIKQGDPICYIVPFKRLDTELVIEDFDKRKHAVADIRNIGTFVKGYLKNYKRLNS